MGKNGEERRRIAIDLVDVVEDSWHQKRAWILRALGFDPGAVPRSRQRVESAIDEMGVANGHDCCEAMNAEIGAPDRILRRRPVRGAVRGLHRLAAEADIYLISGRREEKRSITRAWLASNGLDWIPRERLVLLGFRATRLAGKQPRGKLEWCAARGVDTLVDNQAAQLTRRANRDFPVARVLFSADREEIAARSRGVLVARTWAEAIRVIRRHTALAGGSTRA